MFVSAEPRFVAIRDVILFRPSPLTKSLPCPAVQRKERPATSKGIRATKRSRGTSWELCRNPQHCGNVLSFIRDLSDVTASAQR